MHGQQRQILENKHKPSIELSENSIRVLKSRYLRRSAAGALTESPSGMFERVAIAISRAELTWGNARDAENWQRIFYDMMHGLRFLPNSPTLMNAGTPANQLSACFVLPVEDHLEDIFSTLKLSALIQQRGGGTGFNFSHLRPRNDMLLTTQGTSSGPVAFMRIFDAATEHIRQGGKRRGANMGILNIDHPDIEAFIRCKHDEGAIRNFNISVGVSDAFMQSLTRDDFWPLIHPNTRMEVRRIRARDLWDQIVYHAWLTGDPGLIFLDTINASNPTPALGEIEATNPCGEVPLMPFESCNLGSINLSRFLKDVTIDWTALEKTIVVAIRFLDDVIEVNKYLSSEIREMVEGNRKIGLGIMGWAEALSRLGIPYESKSAVDLAAKLMKFVADKSRDASMALARERGTFGNWKKSVYYPDTPIRNATRTSIAPTGTISIIADTSSSIEPFFALAYQRKHVLEDDTLTEINQSLLDYLAGNSKASEILEAIRLTGTLEGTNALPEQAKRIFKTALEILPEWHLKHQAAFQTYTDNAVSKTINLPQNSTPADVSSIYQSAWKAKLKGITVFRNNARTKQVMQQGITSDIKGCKICIA
ncbi:MAG: adenosylcobalamin-dependent ribonucleoside-diphosphate reductase [Chryseosolibacter sp.]